MTEGKKPASSTAAPATSAVARRVPRPVAHIILASMLLVAFTVPHRSNAHHSVAAFDTSRTMELAGTLTRVELANPHSHFHVATRESEGRVTIWIIEGAGVATVLREVRGGPRDRFTTGQTVTVTFNPASDGRTTGNLVAMRFADGQVLNGIRIP